jgi:hypothetical protein
MQASNTQVRSTATLRSRPEDWRRLELPQVEGRVQSSLDLAADLSYEIGMET